MTVPDWAGEVVGELAWPAIFATVSGAHLYGFPSVDSDVDLRAVHRLPLKELVGLATGPQTLQVGGVRDGVELDVVSHELTKFARMLVKPNGYVLEQLLSPLVVTTSDVHRELVEMAPGLVTVRHAYHYHGFALGQWRRFEQTGELKPVLYMLRVALTGIHLLRTGEIQADLRELWEGHDLPYVPELIEAKVVHEHVQLDEGIVSPVRLYADVFRLVAELHRARGRSKLPKQAPNVEALHDLVVRAHLQGG